VTVWGGFSTRWYGELLHNPAMLSAAWLSLRIAALNATVALCLGTLAALVLERAGRFRGRALFVALLGAPLVLPEVVLGLALLLLFVTMQQWLGWPAERGVATVTLAHTTFTLAFVAMVVRARLNRLDHSLEEAALDLGARPWTVLLTVTLPALAPALAAGWLLAFTLSLDDLVIASFTSGPAATTLPMVVYSSARLGVNPQINALATLLIGAVCIGMAVALLVGRRARR
jgi:putrescine transport system permease protein